MTKKESIGEISIDYNVYCPHCKSSMDDTWDKEWFYNTMGGDFPIDDGYKQKFDAMCPHCNQEFVITGFQY